MGRSMCACVCLRGSFCTANAPNFDLFNQPPSPSTHLRSRALIHAQAVPLRRSPQPAESDGLNPAH